MKVCFLKNESYSTRQRWVSLQEDAMNKLGPSPFYNQGYSLFKLTVLQLFCRASREATQNTFPTLFLLFLVLSSTSGWPYEQGRTERAEAIRQNRTGRSNQAEPNSGQQTSTRHGQNMQSSSTPAIYNNAELTDWLSENGDYSFASMRLRYYAVRYLNWRRVTYHF